MYGAIIKGSLLPIADIVRSYNSDATAAQGDLVNIQSAQLEIAAAGARIDGVIIDKTAVSASSTGVQVNEHRFSKSLWTMITIRLHLLQRM